MLHQCTPYHGETGYQEHDTCQALRPKELTVAQRCVECSLKRVFYTPTLYFLTTLTLKPPVASRRWQC